MKPTKLSGCLIVTTATIIGCGSTETGKQEALLPNDGSRASATSTARPREGEEHPSILEGSVGIVDRGGVVEAGTKVKVMGHLRLRDSTKFARATVMIVSRAPNGRETIEDSQNAENGDVTDGKIGFQAELRTPAVPGSYKLRANSGGKTFAESEITVVSAPDAEATEE